MSKQEHVLTKWVIFCAAMSSSQFAVAQTTDPGQLEDSVRKEIELALPPPPPIPPRPTLARPADADSIRFVLKSVDITGSDKLDSSVIADIYADAIDQEITLDRVYQIADGVTAAYRRAGYVLSQAVVPAQRIKQGAIEIQVVEGFVSETAYATGSYQGSATTNALANKLTSEKPMSISSFERNMLLMNDLPGVSATATIGRSETGGLGSARVLLTSRQNPFTGSLSLNNRGSETTGPGRIELDAIGNLTGLGHTSLGASAVAALDGSELGVASGFVDVGLGATGTSRLKFSLSAVQAVQDVGLAAFGDTESNSIRMGVSYSRPLVRSRLRNVYFSTGFEAFDASSQGQSLGDGTFGTDTETSLRSVSASIAADMVGGGRAISQLNLRIEKGIDGLDAEVIGANDVVDLDYLKAEVSLSRLQGLTNRLSILTALDGQIAVDGRLPGSEVFGIGGQNFLRAYDSSESTAESGLALKAELRLNLGNVGGGGVRLVPYSYLDYGILDEDTRSGAQDLFAVGLGARFSRGRLGGYLELGVPLDGVVALEGTDDPRVFGGVSFSF